MNPHLGELVQALSATPADDEAASLISADLRGLIESGLHPVDIPASLQGLGAAEAFDAAFKAIGGLPRLILFADRNPAAFYKLFARLLVQTSAPITPQQVDPSQSAQAQWPDWLSARRLAYQEAGFSVGSPQDHDDDGDGMGAEDNA